MEQDIDLYALNMPPGGSKMPIQKRISREVWASMHYLAQKTFLSNELGLLVEEIYGEKYATQRISVQLGIFAELGYVEKMPLKGKMSRYRYRVTNLGMSHQRRLFS